MSNGLPRSAHRSSEIPGTAGLWQRAVGFSRLTGSAAGNARIFWTFMLATFWRHQEFGVLISGRAAFEAGT